jgi:hypothetical protein
VRYLGETIAELVERLHHAVPRHAPAHVCKRVRIGIQRLEDVLKLPFLPANVEREIHCAEQLLLLCAEYQTVRLSTPP